MTPIELARSKAITARIYYGADSDEYRRRKEAAEAMIESESPLNQVLAGKRDWHIECGDALDVLRTLPDGCVQTCVTSPPYFGLRNYGIDGQIGLEETPELYVERLVGVFREVRRVLRNNGTAWVNLGDSFSGNRGNTSDHPGFDNKSAKGGATLAFSSKKITPGLKPKDLIGIPWMVAFALRADGWYLRSDIVWAKSNPMPESVTDRPTKSHEYIFLLSKSQRYYYDADAIREPHQTSTNFRNQRTEKYGFARGSAVGDGFREYNHPLGRNKRDVWTVATHPFSGSHFATFPPALIEPCILAGAPEGGIVIDPFAGTSTTGMVSLRRGRRYIGIEIKLEYAEMGRNRIIDDAPLLNMQEVTP